MMEQEKQQQQYNYLKGCVGKEIIRIEPRLIGEFLSYSYTGCPVKLLELRRNGFVIQNPRFEEPYFLNVTWLDGNWYSVEDAEGLPKTTLNNWKGHYIKMNKQVYLGSGSNGRGCYDGSYMSRYVELIAATQHHVIIREYGEIVWLDKRYANPVDWSLKL